MIPKKSEKNRKQNFKISERNIGFSGIKSEINLHVIWNI